MSSLPVVSVIYAWNFGLGSMLRIGLGFLSFPTLLLREEKFKRSKFWVGGGSEI